MEKRSEEDKITQASITVILGGTEYQVAPLVIKESRIWRKKVIALIAPLPGMAGVTIDDAENFQKVLNTMLVTMPDQVIDLFFEYAKDLNKKDIEEKATDAEVAKAFEAVIAVAFPLAQSAPDILRRLQGPEEKASQ